MIETSTTTTVISHIRQWLLRAARSHPGRCLTQSIRPRSRGCRLRRLDGSAWANGPRHGPPDCRRLPPCGGRVPGNLPDVGPSGGESPPSGRPAGMVAPDGLQPRAPSLRVSKRRRQAEAKAIEPVAGSPLDDVSSREQLAILDDELRRLPEMFRLPIVLCCLEGRSQEEAATLLGWTAGSVKGRLERGRCCLRDRLTRRGLTFAALAGAPLMLARPAIAEPLRGATLWAACNGGSTSALVSALANGVSQSAFTASWKTILVVATLGLFGVGMGVAALSGWPKPAPEPAAPPPAVADDKPALPRVDHHGDPLPKGAIARLGSSRLRIGNAAFALTLDGRAIVTVSPQGVVQRFDAKTGRLLERRQLTDRSDVDPVGQSYAQLSDDGRVVAIDEPRDGNRRVSVWDVVSGERIFRRESTEKRRTGFARCHPMANSWGWSNPMTTPVERSSCTFSTWIPGE